MRAYRVAYDGRPFHGFQRQPDVPTVEDALFAALQALDVLEPGADAPPGYSAAGRTDAGVSAVAQTVALEAPDWCSPAAINGELPGAVRAWAVADAPADFHATHDAVAREYTYHLHAPAASLDRARAALAALSGEHDFHNLTPDADGTVRDVAGEIDRDGDFLVLRVRAGGFPRQLVRRLVSVVDAVASGEAGVGRVDQVLSAEPLDGPAGVPAAPPEPLVLTAVEYPDLDLVVDDDAVASARAVFTERRLEARRAARAAGTILDGLG